MGILLAILGRNDEMVFIFDPKLLTGCKQKITIHCLKRNSKIIIFTP